MDNEHTHIFSDAAKCLVCDIAVADATPETPSETPVVETPVEPQPVVETPVEGEATPVESIVEPVTEPEVAPVAETPVVEPVVEKPIDELAAGNLNVVYSQILHLKETSEGLKQDMYSLSATLLEVIGKIVDKARQA